MSRPNQVLYRCLPCPAQYQASASTSSPTDPIQDLVAVFPLCHHTLCDQESVSSPFPRRAPHESVASALANHFPVKMGGEPADRDRLLWSAMNTADRHRSLARPSEVYILTSRRDWHIFVLDLAIEDIRAREYRGTSGSLGSMKVVAEAPAPGAKLITRRSQVRVLAPLQNRRSEAI